MVTDAGYGSEENYAFLAQHSIETYIKYTCIKYTWFDRERKSKFISDISKLSNLYYNEKDDYFVCPIGQKMYLERRYKTSSKNGYEQEISIYNAQDCQGCPMRGVCHKSKDDRRISVNHRLRKYNEKVRENLLSEQGIEYRKKRSMDPESVFGQIKQNKGLRRFSLRGLENVEKEFGMIAIAHNLKKLWKWLMDNKNHGGFTSIFDFDVLRNLFKVFFEKITPQIYLMAA